jgi:hypothetical protein
MPVGVVCKLVQRNEGLVANGADTDRRESDDVDRAIAPAAFAAEKRDRAVKKLPSLDRLDRRPSGRRSELNTSAAHRCERSQAAMSSRTAVAKEAKAQDWHRPPPDLMKVLEIDDVKVPEIDDLLPGSSLTADR